MTNYICPVCGKSCCDLDTLNVCVGQHMQDEKKAVEARTKEILEKKKKTIINKGEELLKIVKEYNTITGNSMKAIYSPPYFMAKCERTKEDIDLNIDKKTANNKMEFDLTEMINKINEKIDNTNVGKNTNKKKNIQFDKDLDTCLDVLLKNLFM